MLKGVLINIYRTGGGDLSNGSISDRHDVALMIGETVPQLFEAMDRPIFRLECNQMPRFARLVPIDLDTRWTMFGGNFGYASDSAFATAVGIISGAPFYGAVPIHDRIEL